MSPGRIGKVSGTLAVDRASVDYAREVDAALIAARREAAGDGDRGLRRHAVDERILSGGGDFAEHEERPERLDFGGDLGIAQIAAAQPRLDGRRELRRREPLRADRSPISGIEMLPAPSTENEFVKLSWPNTMTRSRSPLASR